MKYAATWLQLQGIVFSGNFLKSYKCVIALFNILEMIKL